MMQEKFFKEKSVSQNVKTAAVNLTQKLELVDLYCNQWPITEN